MTSLPVHDPIVAIETAGAAALELLTRDRFSLMLCDLRMPGISGLDMVPRALALDADLGSSC